MQPRGELPTRRGTSTASLLRLGVGLAIVLASYLAFCFFSDAWDMASKAVRRNKIVASRNLGPRERVVLLRHGERHLLLGVAPAV